MEHATKSCRRPPKSERRVHFADSLGMDLVSIFLIDFLKLLHQNLQHQNHHHQPQLQYQKELHQQKLKQQQQQHQNELNLKQQQHHQQHHQHHSSIIKNHHQYQQQQQQQLQQQQQQQPQQSQLLQQHQTQLLQANDPKPPATICQFTQPISLISFKERVRLNKVHLETCQVESRSAGLISVSCSVRVLNLAYEKAVVVRYTSDEWFTHTDCQATYKPGSNDGWSDKFICNFKAPIKGKRLMIAIEYIYGAEKTTCWDNNGGFNYTIQILE